MGNFSRKLSTNQRTRFAHELKTHTEADWERLAAEYDWRMALETPSPAKFDANVRRITHLEGLLQAASLISPAAKHAMRDRTNEPLAPPTRYEDDPDGRPWLLIEAAVRMLLSRPPIESGELEELRAAVDLLACYVAECDGTLAKTSHGVSSAAMN